jgi:hypothetical protein
VSDHDFFFALVLSREDHYGRLLTDVLTTVLGHVGFGPDAVTELNGAIRRAAGGGAPGRPCRVALRAKGRELHVDVTREGASPWRTTRPLP